MTANGIHTGAAGGDWLHSEDTPDGAAVTQIYGQSCVSACGEMLLASHGFPAAEGAQERLVAKLGGANEADRVDFNDLVPALADETGANALGAFFGGRLKIPEEQRASAIDYFCGTGPWAAELKSSRTFHAVIVDGADSRGNLRIRDPFEGTSYTMVTEEFLKHWWNNGAIFWRASGRGWA